MAFPNQRHAPPRGASSLPYTPQRFYSASVFGNQTDFHSHALDKISTGLRHEEIVYTQVRPDWAESVLKQLDKETEHICSRKNYNSQTQTLWIRKMPTHIHDCHQKWVKDEMGRWLQSGLLTLAEWDNINTFVGTTIDFVYGPYTGSRKEPDLLIQPDNEPFPTFVIESGWSESLPQLRDDMNLWLVEGNGKAKATIILNWWQVGNTNQVRGTAELYTPDTNDVPILRQEVLQTNHGGAQL